LSKLLSARGLGAVSGILAIVVFIVAGIVEGSSPKPTATVTKLMSFETSHHSKILSADLLIGISAVLVIIWAAVIAVEFSAAGRRAAAAVLLGSVAARGAVAVVASAIDIGVAQAAEHTNDPGFVHDANWISGYVGTMSFLFLSVVAAAIAVGARGLFPAWHQWFSWLATAAALYIGISVRASGAFSPFSGGALLGALVLFLWVIVTSVLLWRAPSGAASVRAAGADPAPQAA
jgi:hypothetical protein